MSEVPPVIDTATYRRGVLGALGKYTPGPAYDADAKIWFDEVAANGGLLSSLDYDELTTKKHYNDFIVELKDVNKWDEILELCPLAPGLGNLASLVKIKSLAGSKVLTSIGAVPFTNANIVPSGPTIGLQFGIQKVLDTNVVDHDIPDDGTMGTYITNIGAGAGTRVVIGVTGAGFVVRLQYPTTGVTANWGSVSPAVGLGATEKTKFGIFGVTGNASACRIFGRDITNDITRTIETRLGAKFLIGGGLSGSNFQGKQTFYWISEPWTDSTMWGPFQTALNNLHAKFGFTDFGS